jgi:hypothetical protein
VNISQVAWSWQLLSGFAVRMPQQRSAIAQTWQESSPPSTGRAAPDLESHAGAASTRTATATSHLLTWRTY